MEKHFKEFLDDKPKYDLFNRKSMEIIRLHLKTHLHELAEFFSKSKKELKHQDFVLIHQKKYRQLFLLMYFAYLEKSVTEQAIKFTGNEWKNYNFGSTISIEKRILDEIIGSRKNLQKLLIGSGMLLEDEKNKKAVILTQGEGVLSAIQESIGLNLATKSYYLLAHLNTDYIHVSLHQVVKISSPKESAATIVIQDKVVQIENINDTLSKHMWILIGSNNQIECCKLHKKTGSHEMFSYRNYEKGVKELKQHINKIVSL